MTTMTMWDGLDDRAGRFDVVDDDLEASRAVLVTAPRGADRWASGVLYMLAPGSAGMAGVGRCRAQAAQDQAFGRAVFLERGAGRTTRTGHGA